jgi:hypothetical protein
MSLEILCKTSQIKYSLGEHVKLIEVEELFEDSDNKNE